MGCLHRAGPDVPPTDKSTAHVGMIDTDRDIDRLSAGVIYLPKARVKLELCPDELREYTYYLPAGYLVPN